MKNLLIELKDFADIIDFVRISSVFPYPIELAQDKCVVDAKSSLGIFVLKVSEPIKVIAYDEHPENYFASIEKYAIPQH